MKFSRILGASISALCLSLSTAHAGVILNGSSMLDENDGSLTQLENWLGQGELTLTNIFTKNQTDGIAGNDNSYDWHRAVDGKGATFTLWEVTTSNGQGGYDNFILGGYNADSWHSRGHYQYDYANDARENFIFNLTTGVKLDQCQSTDRDCGYNYGDYGIYATYNRANYGATFGGGHDLYVRSDLNWGYNNHFSYGINDPAHFEPEQYAKSLLENNNHSYYWLSIGAYETFTIDSYEPPQAVSEPSSIALLGLGLAGLGFTRRVKLSKS